MPADGGPLIHCQVIQKFFDLRLSQFTQIDSFEMPLKASHPSTVRFSRSYRVMPSANHLNQIPPPVRVPELDLLNWSRMVLKAFRWFLCFTKEPSYSLFPLFQTVCGWILLLDHPINKFSGRIHIDPYIGSFAKTQIPSQSDAK